jgi:uncharacterized protein (TIGR03066 family)
MSFPFLACLLLLTPITLLGEDKLDGKQLIGKWQADKAPDGMDKLVIEYMKEGKLAVEVEGEGVKAKFDGTYALEGNKLTIKIIINGNEKPQKRKIIKLTDSALVIGNEDNSNEERKYKRIK